MTCEFEKVILADGRAVLYRGDSLELLAAGLLKCDAIVADPPYGINYSKHGNGAGVKTRGFTVSGNGSKIHGDENEFDPSPWLEHAPKETAFSSGQISRRIVLWGANHYMQALPKGGTLLAWDKHLGHGPDDNFTDCEWAWCGRRTKREIFRYLWKGLLCFSTKDDCSPTKGNSAARFARVHVSQKPVALMRWCIQKLKPRPDGVILDPYMGSGTTGIAALSLGHYFIGVEIDPGHFATARARIEAWWAEHGSDTPGASPQQGGE